MQGLERLASTLQMMDLEYKSSLCSQFKSIAIEYSDEQAEFVESLGEALGLIEGVFCSSVKAPDFTDMQ